MIYDAVVVGAGPAGSTAAYALSQAGVRVLMLDRAHFPRDKPCGGGVNLRTAALLPFDLSPVVERTVYGASFSLRLRRRFHRRYPEPLAYMTQRRHLDAFLAEVACQAGAEFHQGQQVRQIEIENGRAVVYTQSGSYAARAVIGADGANGVVAPAAGLQTRMEMSVALEGNIPLEEVGEHRNDLVSLDLGIVPGGYGWLFPKGDHINIGVGGWVAAGPQLRKILHGLCRHYGLSPTSLHQLRGHHIPLRRPGSPIVKGPVLLVGDAAGLADPLSGDGMYEAVYSGCLAAQTVERYLAGNAPDLSLYEALVDRYIMPDLVASHQLKRLFYLWPEPYVAMLRYSRNFFDSFCRIVRGELSFSTFRNRLGPLARLVDALPTRFLDRGPAS